MHDPKTVAFEIKTPIPPVRTRWMDRPDAPRWGVRVWRRTNPENLGERVYAWCRPKGYRVYVAGRTYGWRGLATIWHNEPGGADSGTVCRYRLYVDETPRWKLALNWALGGRTQRTDEEGRPLERPLQWSRLWHWHVSHWSLQVFLAQRLRRFLFERCAECGRRFPWGYAPISHSWDSPPSRWFRKSATSYHHECSSLVTARREASTSADTLRRTVAAYRLAADLDEIVAIEHLAAAADGYAREEYERTGSMDAGAGFRVGRQLLAACGWERIGDDYDSPADRTGATYTHGAWYRKAVRNPAIP